MTRKTLIAAAGLLAVLAGCAAPAHTEPQKDPAPSHSVTTEGEGTVSGPVAAEGHGWTADGLDGPIPAPGTCHIRWTADREPLPDPKCTPGAVDSAVTQATLKTTVCRSGGYTSSVRPPVELTDAVKKKLLAAYGMPESDSWKVELDHLIPLTTGGASDVRNLWPQPNVFVHQTESTYVRNDKDQIEQDGQGALCTGTVSLAALQAGFAQDWTQLHLPRDTRKG